MWMLDRSALLLTGALAIAASAASAEPLNIKFGYSNFPSQMVQGVFEVPPGVLKHYGKTYTVQLERASASSAQITAMAAKRIDLSMFSPTAFTLAILNAKLDLRVIGDGIQDGVEGYRSQTVYVKADSPIKTAADLKGRTMGVNGIGSASYTSIVAMLRKHGLTEKDVNFVEVSFANQMPMIEDGKTEASTLTYPLGPQLVKEGKYRLLFTSQEAMGATQFNFIAGTKEFVDENKAAVTDFLEDYTRGLRWFMDPKNKEAAIKLIAKIAKQPEAIFDYVFSNDDYYRDPYMIPSIKGIQTTVDLSKELGFLKEGIDVAKYTDLSMIEEVKKRIEANP
jgi:sulfonate transport system substrate-binding protein